MDEATVINESVASPKPRPGRLVVEKKFALPAVAFCATRGKSPGQVFAGLSDFSVQRIDTAAGEIQASPISELTHSSYVTGIVSARGQLVSGSYDGSLIWWDTETGEQRHRIPDAHARWIRRLAVSPDGSLVASVGDDMHLRLWDLESHAPVADFCDFELTTPQGYPSMLYAVAVSPDGKWVAAGNRTGQVVVRSLNSHHIVSRLETPVMYTWDPKARRHSIGGIRSLAFSRDGNLLAVGGMGTVGNIDHLDAPSRIEVFDWRSGSRKHEIENSTHKGLVEAMHFGPDDAWLLAAGGDHAGFVCAYDMASGEPLVQDKAPMHVHDVVSAESEDRFIAVGHEQGAVIVLAAADTDSKVQEAATS